MEMPHLSLYTPCFSKRLMTRFGLALYLFINLLFVLKYSLRLSATVAAGCTVAYLAFVAIAFLLMRKTFWQRKVSPRALWCIVALAVVALAALQLSINPYQLNVDRWSAISFFLHDLLHGSYPYAAKTHLGGYGSPFPVWQLFHLPFYLLGDVALSFVVATLLFTDSLRRLYGSATALIATLVLMASPAYLYEVAVRSDLITNFLLVAAVINYLRQRRCVLSQHLALYALLIGLTASTRLAAIIPLLIYVTADYLRLRWQKEALFAIAVIAIFMATLLPFMLWDSEMFFHFKYNPLSLQSERLPLVGLLLLFCVCLYAAYAWRNSFMAFHFLTAVCLFASVVLSMGSQMLSTGNANIFSSSYDITYYNMSLPFVITTISGALSKPTAA